MNSEADHEVEAPRTPVTVRNWYDDRANVAALIRYLDSEFVMSTAIAVELVAKPWTYDNDWDDYQASLPAANRWCARGTR